MHNIWILNTTLFYCISSVHNDARLQVGYVILPEILEENRNVSYLWGKRIVSVFFTTEPDRWPLRSCK